jgi:hypothetical protein
LPLRALQLSLQAAPNALPLLFAVMSAALLLVLFVLLSSRLLSPGRSAITAQLPACATVKKLCLRQLLPSLHNVAVGTLVVARLLAKRWERPRRLRVIALHFAFTATVRVIDRVHGHAANRWLDAPPPRAACLAERFIFMVEVADLADRRHAIQRKLANFAGRQLHQRNVAFFAQ